MSCTNPYQNENCGCTSTSQKTNWKESIIYFVIAILGGLLLVTFNIFKDYEEEAFNTQSLGMVFILGFITGLHCVGMCGGFMMSYMRYGKQRKMSVTQMHTKYAISKIISYSVLGALFAFLGSMVYFTTDFKANASYLGGVFLLYLGARGLGVFEKLKFPKVTDYIKMKSDRLSNPIYVGLLNGLMISCAPLQALYLLSASIGNPLDGAILLGVFAIGTLPIFLFYGVIMSSIHKLKGQWSDRITASIIIVFGILMLNRGMALGGNTIHLPHVFDNEMYVEASNLNIVNAYQVIKMDADASGWGSDELRFQKGNKVRWEIDVSEITYCNRTIEIPKLGIKKELHKGLNVIEFDPLEYDELVYTCWMGMLTGTFITAK
jgi:sulfite exporter TauE/SafE